MLVSDTCKFEEVSINTESPMARSRPKMDFLVLALPGYLHVLKNF